MPRAQTDDLSKQAEQVGTAQAELAALRVEHERLPEELRKAAAEGDAERLVKLRQRAEELPTHIWGAEMRATRLAITLDELRMHKFDAEAKAAEPAVEPAKEALEEAQKAYNDAVWRLRGAMAQRDEARQRIAANERYLERLMAEQAGPVAPVVRSLPHASQGAA